MTTVKKSLNSGGRMSRNGETSEKSQEKKSLNGAEQLTLFQEDSLAKISLSPVQGEELKEKDQGFGRRCSESFAKYDQDIASWKTSQLCLDGGLELFLETWPRAGLMRNGNVYLLNSLEQDTEEIESGLLPTPNVADAGAGGVINEKTKIILKGNTLRKLSNSGQDYGLSLARFVQMFPTPQAQDHKCSLKTKYFNLVNILKGRPNPIFVEWLMRIPLNWTDLNFSETAKTLKLSNGSGKE